MSSLGKSVLTAFKGELSCQESEIRFDTHFSASRDYTKPQWSLPLIERN